MVLDVKKVADADVYDVKKCTFDTYADS